jgi:hypothetical protein
VLTEFLLNSSRQMPGQDHKLCHNHNLQHPFSFIIC